MENILSLTRLQEGRMVIKKQPEAVEGNMGWGHSADGGTFSRQGNQVEVPEEVPDGAHMDARLIMQVLINLLDNGVKHTPRKEIKITVKRI